VTKKTRQLFREQSAFLLAEEAIELVLRAGPAAFSVYLIGTLPFLVGVIVYWAAMASNAYAHQYASAGALALALLFIWMKALQARYAQHLLCHLQDEDTPAWTINGFFSALSRQGAIHASAILLYPICFVTVLPMCFVVGWYQNVTTLESSATGTRALIRDAAAQARLWPKQIHLFLWLSSPLMVIAGAGIFLGTFPILDGLVTPEFGDTALLTIGYLYGGIVLLSILPLAPFACFVLLNVVTGLVFAIEFFHILSGADTLYSRNPAALLSNSTLIAAACAITYLCLDPVLKAGFAIRCYRGLSLQSGTDLRVGLALIRQRAVRSTAALLLAAMAAGLWHATPAYAQAPVDQRLVTLDQALDKELAAQKYTWRMPREPNPDVEMPWLLRALSDLGESIRDGIGAAFRFLGDLWERFTDWLNGGANRSTGDLGFSGFNPSWRHFIVLLLVLLAAATIYLLWRFYRAPVLDVLPAQDALPPATPDIADEATTAAELPEDEWYKLARELASKGEFRLAARALFFSCLAVLAQREVIRIARFKSNMDYANEMARRAGALGEAPAAFSESALIYESVWYGEHLANAETLNRLHACQERLRHAGS